MASTFSVSRVQIIYTLCLPLAVLLGYFLADPMQSGSMAVVFLVVSVLSVPLLMRWYHPLLVFSCNAAFSLYFLPGGPSLWMLVVVIGLFFVVLNRCIDSSRRLMVGGLIPWSLLVIGIVVVGTAFLTGGAGIKALGGSSYGGRHYINIAAAIALYFVLAANPIPISQSRIYYGLFFLSGITGILSVLVYVGGDRFSSLYLFIPRDLMLIQAANSLEGFQVGLVRMSGFVSASSAICLFMLARYGVKGVLDVAKGWRLLLVGLSLGFGLLSGFRSFFGFILLVFAIGFFLERLHRTRYFFNLALVAVLCFCGLLAFSSKLPFTIQRSLSFLPIEISPMAKQDAQGSLEWRLEMWKHLLPDVPRYLFKGKGYAIDPGDLFLSRENGLRGYGSGSDSFIVSGDYHNGPLSVVIPFGIWGAAAFIWFLYATGRVLYQNYANGNPTLKTINTALFACFLAHLVFFVFFIGGFETDLAFFTALGGMGVSLNRMSQPQPQPQVTESTPEFTTPHLRYNT
jgi:hypothetical protein